ncbi:putative membrane protein (TIGR02234 family) [Kitasatospora sp. GP30]|uniref:TIGR02234 family membrane protein n=1 Tax=Kitasatospora sp. GP30 TaxID=3035084 RepID=UPI000C709542|nr:TIGR02234 family membrane protein [Kitasatospora sp. GP30]MDH6144606.1 putative membrane protein (TIGR02234 family) [Kitasatospora sp. GP30]
MTAAPAPAPESAAPAAETAPARPAAARRSLGVMLLLIVVGATLVLWAVGRSWASGKVAGLDVTASGSDISGLPSALALVSLASGVAVFAVRGAARAVVGGLVVLAGLGTAAAAGLGAGDTAALDSDAARKLGLTGVTAEHVGHTAWPWVALLGGLLLAVAGLLTIRQGKAWPSMGARYDAPTARRAATAAKSTGTPADLWKALDRGEDPTA